MNNKLMIFGDSILRGVTYSQEKNKYLLCEDYTLPQIRSLGYTVQNHARMGATIEKGVAMMDAFLPECDKDTDIIIEFGGNDCDHNWTEVAQAPSETHLPHTVEDVFTEKMTYAIQSAKATGGRVYVCSLLPIDAEKYFSFISKERSAKNILGWLGDVSMLYRFQEHYNKLVEKIAMRCGCPLIPIRETFLLSHRYETLLCADGIHPSEEGHRLMEKTICDFLQQEATVCA